MSRTSENEWTPDDHRSGEAAFQPARDFELRQRGKPLKTVIGVGILAIIALVLTLMHPVPHDVPDVPAWTTGQATR